MTLVALTEQRPPAEKRAERMGPCSLWLRSGRGPERRFAFGRGGFEFVLFRREQLREAQAGELEGFFAGVGDEGGVHGVLKLALGGGADLEAEAVDQVTRGVFRRAGGEAVLEGKVGCDVVFVEHGGVKRLVEWTDGAIEADEGRAVPPGVPSFSCGGGARWERGSRRVCVDACWTDGGGLIFRGVFGRMGVREDDRAVERVDFVSVRGGVGLS